MTTLPWQSRIRHSWKLSSKRWHLTIRSSRARFAASAPTGSARAGRLNSGVRRGKIQEQCSALVSQRSFRCLAAQSSVAATCARAICFEVFTTVRYKAARSLIAADRISEMFWRSVFYATIFVGRAKSRRAFSIVYGRGHEPNNSFKPTLLLDIVISLSHPATLASATRCSAA